MKRKVTKESFQGEEETEGFLFPLKITPISFLMGMGDSVSNRDCIGHKRVTATASGDSSFPVGMFASPIASHPPSLPLRGRWHGAAVTDEVLLSHPTSP